MSVESVAVATLTWARSDAEARVLRDALDVLVSHGLPIAVADKGSNPPFAAYLRERRDLTVIHDVDGGLVAQMRAAMSSAARFGRRYVLYTEPDKIEFFRDGLAGFLRAALDPTNSAGVVLSARSEASFATYPLVQQRTERIINDLCADVIGVRGDYSYGPFVMPAQLLPRVQAFEPSLGWGWRHRVFLAAHRAGLGVSHVAADHPCPPEGRLDEAAERAHRLRQLSQNILGLIE